MSETVTDAEVEAAAWGEFDRIYMGNPSATLKLAVVGAVRHALTAAASRPAQEGWQPIETAPTDNRRLWISDGNEVWAWQAHKDGSHKRAPRSKFWMDAREPAPPGKMPDTENARA